MSEETDNKTKEPAPGLTDKQQEDLAALLLDDQQRHELALIAENGHEILNIIHEWIRDRQRKSGVAMKAEFDYPLRHSHALTSWLYALGEIATGGDSGICPECELLEDHAEGCSVDWELNREAMEASGPKHFDPKDGSAW